jgi:hypothetical protein
VKGIGCGAGPLGEAADHGVLTRQNVIFVLFEVAELEGFDDFQSCADPEAVAGVDGLVRPALESSFLAEQQPPLHFLQLSGAEQMHLITELECGEGTECRSAMGLHLEVLADSAVVTLRGKTRFEGLRFASTSSDNLRLSS